MKSKFIKLSVALAVLGASSAVLAHGDCCGDMVQCCLEALACCFQ